MTQKTWLLLCLIVPFFSISQETNKNHEIIFNAYSQYFNPESESISIHLNKDFFINNETIFFKGIVLNKNKEKLHAKTTNVYVNILNEKLEEIQSNLFYVKNGIFIGQLELDETYKPGMYFIHTYTNYMNNMVSDESTLIPIQIINKETSIYENKVEDIINWNIKLVSEGGAPLHNTKNNFGVHISNNLGKGEQVKDILVIDSDDIVVNKFSTNTEGYGSFEILKYKNHPYKLQIEKNNQKTEVPLPNPVNDGININVIKEDNKTSFEFITNIKTSKSIINNVYTILLEKNKAIKLTDFKFNTDLIRTLTVSNDSIEDGINTIRLIDSNLNLVAERTFYNIKKQKTHINLKKGETTKDSITIYGKINGNNGNLSVSVLPSKTLSKLDNNTNFISLKINNYLNTKLQNHSFYFENETDPNYKELDLVLIHETKSKNKFEEILNAKTNTKYPFDIGLSVKGKINNDLSKNDLDDIKVSLYSINGILEYANLNEKNEFEFNNLLAMDSTIFYLKTLKKDKEMLNINEVAYLTNNKRKFIKPITYFTKKEDLFQYAFKDTTILAEFKTDNKVIDLKEVILTKKIEKNKFENLNIYNNNAMTRAYKINENMEVSFIDVINFIRTHSSYQVLTPTPNAVSITNRNTTSITGSNTPLVFINDVDLGGEFQPLVNLSLRDIDEIYINQRGYGTAGIRGMNGSIRIYLKKYVDDDNERTENRQKQNQLIVKDGFKYAKFFENPKNINYNSDYFNYFGNVQWIPNIITNSQGEFSFKIPKTNHENLIFNIQGIDDNGNLYYENKLIEIN